MHHRLSCPARLALLTLCCLVALAAGCRPKQPPPELKLKYDQELPPGERALRKIPPDQYPDFSVMQTDPAALARSIDYSLQYLDKPSSGAYFLYLDISHDRAVATLRAMRQVLASTGGRADWNAEVRQKFDVYKSIGAPRPDGTGYSGQVLFTGYCTPVYDASLTRTGPFQWPIYKRPADLVVINEETGAAVRRSPGGPDVPYYTRAEIERDGRLAGQEFVWLKSRWDAYVITIQGSARLRLTDGRIDEVGYAGSNGHPYASPGVQMLADGVITREQRNFAGMRSHFGRHPEQMDRYLWLNPRTVFFTERPGGPFGKLNVPVTPMASIATDKTVYPRAMPAFVSTRLPQDAAGLFHSMAVAPAPSGSNEPNSVAFRGFMLDQDAGGAIRAAGRCDLYVGIGEQAERIAGEQVYAGELYYLAIKPELVQQYLGAGK